MSVELKPCPFCGKPAYLQGGSDPKHLIYWVECTDINCMGQTRCMKTKEEAIALWNRRVKHDDQA